MDWSKFLSVENVMFLFAALGWLLVVVMAVLRWIAPKTETKADDDVLGKLEWLGTAAPAVFAKVKWLHESGQLPAGVDRYTEYLIRLGEAFGASFKTGNAMLPESLRPTAKLLADGMHAEQKMIAANPTQSPVSK